MFAIKPPTAEEEFAELHNLLGTADIAEVLGKRPETVSRLKTRARYTRSLERLIDDVWSVVHVATTRAEWHEDRIRAFLLLRQPELDLRPAGELIRAGQTEAVLEAIVSVERPLSARARRRRSAVDPAVRADAQQRLAARGLSGLDRERLLAAGHEAWGTRE